MSEAGQRLAPIKQLVLRLSPFVRWAILGGTLFFVAKAIKDHWQEVAALRISGFGLALLAIAFLATLGSHLWSAWVWDWILWELNQPVRTLWGICVFLQTNIAKYIPGNVWHFYGRIMAAKTAGFSVGATTLSVMMESLLMAAAALAIALISNPQSNLMLQGLVLLGVLIGVHPRLLNPLIQLASRLKGKSLDSSASSGVQLSRYPLMPFLGEVGFVLFRTIGFLLIVAALHPVSRDNIPVLISSFSIAWVLGLVVPGAPGGLGVFESTAIALLGSHLGLGVVLGAVALYRLISTLGECAGAALGWLGQRYLPQLTASTSRHFPVEKS